MIRNITRAAVLVALTSGAAWAAGEVHIEDVAFPHEGPFGAFDQMQLQRGLPRTKVRGDPHACR